MKVKTIDHLVLTVADIDRSVDFYRNVMGFEKVRFGDDRIALHSGSFKINLHRAGYELEPRAACPKPGSADLCFIIETTLEAAIEHLHSCGVEIIDGPVPRTGANGPILSVYFRDPDLNLIEVSNEIQEP